ncbi:hypothetical protein [Candidatus Vidania fulgoroideorum]
MYNPIYNCITYRKINIFNFKNTNKIKNILRRLIGFFLLNKNYLVNVIFLRNYGNNNNFYTYVFNKNSHKVLFNVYVSDIFINFNKTIFSIQENLFHCFYHILDNKHSNVEDYINMIFYFYIFFKNNE